MDTMMMESLSDMMARCFETVQDEEDQETIPVDHKCWNCEWRTFVGSGFFCPLVGCVKSRREVEEFI